MGKIERALVSVSDKKGIVEFAKDLSALGVEIISTGGTASLFRQNSIAVKDVSEITGFPEMMDGRVKTLHPKVHGGILALRDQPEHLTQMRDHGILPIDLVVVNLYPFEATVARKAPFEEVVEQIDIGGGSREPFRSCGLRGASPEGRTLESSAALISFSALWARARPASSRRSCMV